MSSHTEINTDGENFGVLSTPQTHSLELVRNLLKIGKIHFLEPERRNYLMLSKCSQRDFEVNKEVDFRYSPSALQIKSCCLKNALQNRVPPPQ